MGDQMKLQKRILSSKFIYGLVAAIALISGLLYKMGWLSKVPMVNTVSSTISAASTVVKNTPILRFKQTDVFDGEVPPYEDSKPNSVVSQQKFESESTSSIEAIDNSTVEPIIENIDTENFKPSSSIKLDTSAPTITLAKNPISNSENQPTISINI